MLGGGNVFTVFYSPSSFVNKAYLKNNFPTDLSYVFFFFTEKRQMCSVFITFSIVTSAGLLLSL